MYIINYDHLEEDCYVEFSLRHPSQFLHRVRIAPPDVVRREIFTSFRGDISFSALVRIFESIGVINWPIHCGMVGVDLAVHYRVAARLLDLSEERFLRLLDLERLTPQSWVPKHHFDERGVVFVNCPRFRRAELDMFRDVLARVYMMKHPGATPTHYVSHAPLRSSNVLAKNLMPGALRRFLEVEACLTCLSTTHIRLSIVLKHSFMRIYPKLAIAIRLLLLNQLCTSAL